MASGVSMIPHNRPCITTEDKASVEAVLCSNWIAEGPAVRALESSFVGYFGGGSACALSSGTAALFLALKVLNAATGDTVAVPTYACSALLNAVFMTGAMPQVVDVRADDFCLNPAEVERQAAHARLVIAVHTFGAPADVEALHGQGRQVIEDCCQALGGMSSAGLLGTQGAAAVFSFYATKIVTSGQGGLLWSRDPAVAEAARDYREFDCRESYIPRFNFQMTDIQAALVNSQMARLAAIRARRAAIVERYLAVLPSGLSVQSGLCDTGRMAYRCTLLAPDMGCREVLRAHLASAGISCIVPIERHELLHRYLKLDPADYPVAERIADTSLSLPLYPALEDADIDQICHTLQRFRP